jgi:hypothetical protein
MYAKLAAAMLVAFLGTTSVGQAAERMITKGDTG